MVKIGSNDENIDESLKNFYLGIKTEATKGTYSFRLLTFLKYVGLSPDELVKKAREDSRGVEMDIIKYIREREKVVSGNDLRCFLASLKLFMEMNDIGTINWAKISRLMPPSKHIASDRSPTVEEIRTIIDNWEIRYNAVVLIQISGGFRVGSFKWLNFGDIEPVFEREDPQRGQAYEVVRLDQYGSCLRLGWRFLCAKVTIYRGEPEEYYTFISPEAFNSLLKYKDLRETHGEVITPSSPLIRDKWDLSHLNNPRLNKTNILEPKRVTPKAISLQVDRRLRAIGIRAKTRTQSKGSRYEFKQVHGFRKFFETNTKRVLKGEDVETLKGKRFNYYKPDFEYLLREYLKAIPYLTINETYQIKDQLKKSVVESNKRVGELQRENLSIRSKMDKFEREMLELRDLVQDFMSNLGSRSKDTTRT